MSNRIWLWSQTAAFVGVAIAVAVGLYLTTGDQHIDNEFTVSINATFFGPGLLVSLAVNQIVLLLRKPRVVRLAEKVLLAVDFALIVLLIVCNLAVDLTVIAGLLSILLAPMGLAVLIVTIVGNADFRRAPSAQPAPLQ